MAALTARRFDQRDTCDGVVRCRVQHLAIRRLCLVPPIEKFVCLSEIEASPQQVRVERDRPSQQFHTLVELVLLYADRSQNRARDGFCLWKFERRFGCVCRCGKIARLHEADRLLNVVERGRSGGRRACKSRT